MKTCWMAALLCLAACKDEKKDEQSFRQAMQIICTAHTLPAAETANPADRQRVISEGVKEKVTNREALIVFEEVAVAAPAKRTAILEDAAKKAGLDGCAMIDALDPARGLALPVVEEAPLDPFDTAPIMVLSDTVVVVEGEQLDLEKLERFAGALLDAKRAVQGGAPDRTIAVAADPATSYDRLFTAVHALAKAGARPIILARDGSRIGSIPLDIPDKAPVDMAPSVATQDEPLGMVVAVTPTELTVFSLSQLEGTLPQPLVKLPHDRLADLAKTLAEVAERRWAGKTRSADDERIILMFDGKVPAQTVVAVMAAARNSFPRLLWSRGFE